MKLLFICKEKTSTDHHCEYSNGEFSSGLYNSAINVVNMLNDNGIPSKLVTVVDNNCIDREVTEYKPTHVFIEALWVIPEKFEVLTRLHPDVKWIIRVHSETPFLANEGVAVDWIFKYVEYANVYVAFNSNDTFHDFSRVGKHVNKFIYLPNYYEGRTASPWCIDTNVDVLDVGCFGAIRPLKNQLIQAIAAVDFANRTNRKLRFHINATRVEQKGESVLKNIRGLFANYPNHELVEHPWMAHQDFVDLISTMDINLQVSLSETFNIVTADAVVNNVPVVTSKEVNWVCRLFQADATSLKSIVFRMYIAYILGGFGLHTFNKFKLDRYNSRSRVLWLKYLR